MIGNRIGVLIDYLRAGNEVKIEDIVYVWLDNHVVRENETHQFIIDGLAMKMPMYSGTSEGAKDQVHYVGAWDTSIQRLVKMVESMEYDTFVDMYNFLVGRGDR